MPPLKRGIHPLMEFGIIASMLPLVYGALVHHWDPVQNGVLHELQLLPMSVLTFWDFQTCMAQETGQELATTIF
jgi:hypothetical protein